MPNNYETANQADMSAKIMGLTQASREKYWAELSIEEKIERLRTEVKRRGYRLESVETEVQKLNQDFPRHSHGESGVLVPLTSGQPWGYCGGAIAGLSTGFGGKEESEYF